MKHSEPKVVGLTIYLLREGTSEDDVFTDESVQETETHKVTLNERAIGLIRSKQSEITPPSWASFFAGSLESNVKFRRASISAVYVTSSAERLFAIVFGQGRHFIRPEVIDDRFGLKVTINSVDPDKLRVVDATTSESNPIHSRRQSSRLADLGYFGLNLDQDILRAVTGVPLDESLGTLMSGIDGLTVRARVTLRNLRPLLKRYLEKSEEKTYQQRFKWIDQVREVRDPTVRSALFGTLARTLRNENGTKAWAAIPELIDWTTFDGFHIGARNALTETTSCSFSSSYTYSSAETATTAIVGVPRSANLLMQDC